MYTIVSFDCKFKGNRENIERTLQRYGLRKLQPLLYAGDLENGERETLTENISKIVKQTDSVLIVPICQSCFTKKEKCGREIKFDNDLYRVY
ncbi:CRISPR-associated endonuclease Cas2 [uncultured Methanobrevibacter sp.]|uniref:CRISPR-associated endonuclease Cas2 n=1 Tax=uncultured Methanobrevibacter sp. TaxID=253161 RepID=UPI0025E6F427|nr:CRISPR-associated endonuclease Cas2 [uncultured Methanobrevibacter sp.]